MTPRPAGALAHPGASGDHALARVGTPTALEVKARIIRRSTGWQGWSVSAIADGVIEAIEAPGHPFALAVQWHRAARQAGGRRRVVRHLRTNRFLTGIHSMDNAPIGVSTRRGGQVVCSVRLLRGGLLFADQARAYGRARWTGAPVLDRHHPFRSARVRS
jgi:hypothetical protein